MQSEQVALLISFLAILLQSILVQNESAGNKQMAVDVVKMALSKAKVF